MGLYDDLQDDLVIAFNGDLSDAVKSITISQTIVSGYDAATGTQTSTSSIYETRGVVAKNESDKDSDSVMREGLADILILDREKAVPYFDIEMDVFVGDDKYTINGLETDPVGATHTLTCRLKNASH